jgi:hypothetical protein
MAGPVVGTVPFHVPELAAAGVPNAGHDTEDVEVAVAVMDGVDGGVTLAVAVLVAVSDGCAPDDNVADGDDVVEGLAVPVWVGDGVALGVGVGVGSTYV